MKAGEENWKVNNGCELVMNGSVSCCRESNDGWRKEEAEVPLGVK